MKKLLKLSVASTLVLAFAAQASLASAATISRTFTLTGTDFVKQFGLGTALPIDPLSIKFSVSFDNTVSATDSTSGLTILSNPFSTPLVYGYNPGNDFFSIAPSASPGGCGNGSNSTCWFINGVSSLAPILNFAIQTPNNGDGFTFYAANTRSISFVEGLGAVPEPASWALMIAGFGLVGSAMRRRKPSLSVSYS